MYCAGSVEMHIEAQKKRASHGCEGAPPVQALPWGICFAVFTDQCHRGLFLAGLNPGYVSVPISYQLTGSSVGTSVLGNLKTSMQCPGCLLLVTWVFQSSLHMPDFRLQFHSLRSRVLTFLPVHALPQDLVPGRNCWTDPGESCHKGAKLL